MISDSFGIGSSIILAYSLTINFSKVLIHDLLDLNSHFMSFLGHYSKIDLELIAKDFFNQATLFFLKVWLIL